MAKIDDTLTMTVLPYQHWEVRSAGQLLFSWMDRFGAWLWSRVIKPEPKEKPLGTLTLTNLSRLVSMREKNDHGSSEISEKVDLKSHNQLSQRLKPILDREKVCIFRAAAEKSEKAQAAKKHPASE